MPFFFNLTGGLGGQHGKAYLTGRVNADFLDTFPRDVIATERQRIDWQTPETQVLLEWGRTRIQELLRLWQERRAEVKEKTLQAKLATFSKRIDALPKHERDIVVRVVRNLGKIQSLDQDQFENAAETIVTAWEGGRLRELITDLANIKQMDEEHLLLILFEANVLADLQTAETVKAKLKIIDGLRQRVEAKELENAVRDYIANHPWLISPTWETFKIETSVNAIIEKAEEKSGISKDKDFDGRVDLVLASGETLLVLEFMRPGLTANYDHVSRFQHYVADIIRKRHRREHGRTISERYRLSDSG